MKDTQIITAEAWGALQDAILYVQRRDKTTFGVRTRRDGFVRTYTTAARVGDVYAADVPGVGLIRRRADGWQPPGMPYAFPGLIEAVRGAFDAK